MSDKNKLAFDKYLRHIEIMSFHEDQVLSNHAFNIFECAKKAQVEGLEKSGLSDIPNLNEDSSEDKLALNSINYIHSKLIENA